MAGETPDRIGRYEILQELGSGSMGRVYLARDPTIDRRIAVKVLAPLRGVSAEEEAELRRRFILEARAAGRVSHPGIVTVFDAETDPESGSSFIAMEWVDGQSLEELLHHSALSVDEVVSLGEQVALALDAAHRAQLVHRDIKPANILLDRAGRAKISDFGIAKFISMSNTAAGRLVGSPFYMSPEQIRNETVDRRSDLFSLGSVLYQAATGEVPFASDSLAGITYKILEIDPAPAMSINAAVGPQLGAVIEKALQKAPQARYQTGLEFAQALRGLVSRAASSLPISPVPNAPRDVAPPRSRLASPSLSRLARSAEPSAIRATNLSDETLDAASRSTTPTGTVILPQDGTLDELADTTHAAASTRSRPWIARHRGPLLAGLTLLALPVVLLMLVPAREEPAPDIPEASPAPPPRAPTPVPAPAESTGPVEPMPAPTTLPPADETAEPMARSPATSAEEEPARPAVVEVRYRNHLRGGRMTIRVDDAVVWSGEVGADKGLLGRTIGNTVRPRITVPAGKHVIGIRIEGADGTVNATKRIWAVFASGSRPRLKVRLVPPRVLRLSWDD